MRVADVKEADKRWIRGQTLRVTGKGGDKKTDAERGDRYMPCKHVRSHDFSTYADICRLPQTRAYGTQTVLQRQS